MNSPVTNRDVAEATGVSTTVVSWVLNGRAEQNRVSAETQRRVKAAISQLGYVPSQVARSLSPAGKGGLLSGTSNLTTVLSAAGYHLVSVANVEDLRRLTAEGLVGVLYRRPSTIDHRPETLPVEPQAPLQAPVDADVPALSIVEGPAASVTRIDPPGTNAAGTSASTLEPEPASQPPPGIEATPTPPPAPVVVPPPIPTPAPAPTPPIVEVAPAVFISESGSDEPSAMGGQASTSEKTEAPPMATPNDNTENNNA